MIVLQLEWKNPPKNLYFTVSISRGFPQKAQWISHRSRTGLHSSGLHQRQKRAPPFSSARRRSTCGAVDVVRHRQRGKDDSQITIRGRNWTFIVEGNAFRSESKSEWLMTPDMSFPSEFPRCIHLSPRSVDSCFFFWHVWFFFLKTLSSTLGRKKYSSIILMGLKLASSYKFSTDRKYRPTSSLPRVQQTKSSTGRTIYQLHVHLFLRSSKAAAWRTRVNFLARAYHNSKFISNSNINPVQRKFNIH